MHPWRDWLLRFVLTMSAAALVMAGGWFWLFHGTTPPGAAATYLLALPLVVNPAELDLGEVWEDSHFEWTFCARQLHNVQRNHCRGARFVRLHARRPAAVRRPCGAGPGDLHDDRPHGR